MPPKYDIKKAFLGANNQRRLKSASKAYTGKNAERKRRNTAGAIRRYVNAYGPTLAGALTGMGDYQVRDPGSLGRSYRVGRGIHPESGSMGYVHGKTHHSHSSHHPHTSMEKGMMSIKHSEYIGDLISSATTGSSNFVSQSYALNPGNSGTFPWLASTAINFQHYRFKKLVFEYRPLTSESTSSTAVTLLSMGSVIAATQYNSVLGPYTTKQQMAESDFSVTTKPSEHMLHAVECDPRFNPLGELFISAQTSLTIGANSSDIRMQNLGIFQISSCNIPVAASTAIDLGEIWVHYEVELYKPQINAYLSGLLSSHYTGTSSTGNPTNSNPFGPNILATVQPVATANNLLALTFGVSSFTFPLQVTSGQYLCVYYAKGGAAACAYTAPTCTNGTIDVLWTGGTLGTDDVSTVAGAPQTTLAGATQLSIAFVVNVNAPGASLCVVTMAVTVVPVTGSFDLIVTPYNSIMN
nr:putative capsid protein [Crucivirus sp.]